MRVIPYIVLLSVALADWCKPTFSNIPYDLTKLQRSDSDYYVKLYSPDDSWNRT